MSSEAAVHIQEKTPSTYSADEIELFVGFGKECEEKVNELESLVLVFETESTELEHAKGIYRILHTIKGTAASVGLTDLAHFSHQFEDYIVPFRDGKRTASPAQFSVMLAAVEWLKVYFDKLKSGVVAPADPNYWKLIQQTPNGKAQALAPKESKAPSRKFSIDLDVIDLMLSRSGNIMILQDLIQQDIEELSRRIPNNSSIKTCLGHLNEMKKENDELQTSVSRLKKTNISAALRIVQRTIRDLSIQLGKNVHLEMSGTNVPIDYDVCQVITDSLVHLVRNSLDHGIETPEERKQKGKNPQATVKIHLHQGDDEIRIDISDDGRGIDVEKVKAKALSKGVVSKEKLAGMSVDAICSLIFESGFSTAEKVTEVSGRGVGLDMVMNAITGLKGQVAVSTVMNAGTSFKIMIPEKKAAHISKSFISTCDGYHIAIASEHVSDINDMAFLKNQKRIFSIENKLYLFHDSKYLPIINPITRASPDEYTHQGIVCVVNDQKSPFALFVNEFHGLEKVIVKDIKLRLDGASTFTKAALTGRYGLALFLDLSQFGDRV